jgi:GNAT superfamily N-acetyltransferase
MDSAQKTTISTAWFLRVKLQLATSGIASEELRIIVWLGSVNRIIVLKPEFRGKGYGKSAMQLFEEDVKVKGVGKTGLHVFSFNEPAVKLYKSMGYSTTDLSMQKSL